MPSKYNYEHMPDGRMKALNMAYERYTELFKRLSKAEIIDPSILETMRVIHILLARANNSLCCSKEDIQLLNDLLGPNMGTTYHE